MEWNPNVELSSACGCALSPQPHALDSSTFGFHSIENSDTSCFTHCSSNLCVIPKMSTSDAHWNESFSHRPSWCDARMSLEQIKRGKAKGNKPGLYVRSGLQWFLFKHGCFIQRHCLEVLFSTIFVMCLISAGLRNAKILTDINKLWIPRGGRLERESNFRGKMEREFRSQLATARIKRAIDHDFMGTNLFRFRRSADSKNSKTAENPEEPAVPNFAAEGGLGGGFQVTIQTPKKQGMNILTQEDLLLHSKVMVDVAQLSVPALGVDWKMSDLCFKPPSPEVSIDFLGPDISDKLNVMLDQIIPCMLISPLDCFWDGSKPLGPHPALNLPMASLVHAIVPEFPLEPLSWKNFNPMAVLDGISGLGVDLGLIIGTFERAGIGAAYQNRTCLDPLDPECPSLAPNHVDMCSVTQKFLQWSEASKYLPSEEDRTTTTTTTTTTTATIANISKAAETYSYDDYNYGYNDYNYTDTASNSGNVAQSSDGGGSDFLGLLGGLFGDEDDDEDSSVPTECKDYQEIVRRLLRKQPELISKFLTEEERKSVNLSVVEYGKLLTGGCPGFARNILQWPEPMIIGGMERREDGEIYKVEALQTVMMLSGGGDVYKRFQNCSKGRPCHTTKAGMRHEEWTPGMAEHIVATWQRKFVDYIYNHENNTVADGTDRQVHPLAGTSLEDMLKEFSKFKPYVILIGYVLMLIYAGFCLFSLENSGIESCAGLAVAGVLLVTFASVSGLGFSTLIGVQFNAATTQIVPFLTLGLGVDDMFLLVHNYKEVVATVSHHELGYLLKETGLSVLLTSINNILAFLAGSLVPVPAMKDFCIQTAILLFFNVIAILTVYPAMMAVDIFRRKSGRIDILCCVKVRREDTNNNAMISPHQVAPVGKYPLKKNPIPPPPPPPEVREEPGWLERLSLQNFVINVYTPFIQKLPVKIVALIFFGIMLSASIYGVSNSVQGLDLTDVIPKGTAPYSFLEAREKYFSFYPMFTILKGQNIDFPNQQEDIRNFHADIMKSKYIVASKGKLGEYWLNMMRDYIADLQEKFQTMAVEGGEFNGTHLSTDASDEVKLAYTLICNTGEGHDCNRVSEGVKMIYDDGSLNPGGFYKYLTAWKNLDNMMYYVSQAALYPVPPSWSHDSKNFDNQTIPAAFPPWVSQIPFFMNGVVDTTETVKAIKEIRAICEKHTARGLGVFPQGIPFTFWEQYLFLIQNLVTNIAIITGCVFCVITLLLMSPWTAAIIVAILLMMVVELAGFMGLVGLKLNPISVVSLITAVGIGVEFTVHMSLSFLTSLGTRNERIARTLEHMFVPVTHGGVSTLLGIIMLAFSEFEFIVRYFFMVMAGLIVIGLLNGLILLPVLLSLIGPSSEVRVLDGTKCLPPPSPRIPKHREEPIPDDQTEMKHVNSANGSGLVNTDTSGSLNGHLSS